MQIPVFLHPFSFTCNSTIQNRFFKVPNGPVGDATTVGTCAYGWQNDSAGANFNANWALTKICWMVVLAGYYETVFLNRRSPSQITQMLFWLIGYTLLQNEQFAAASENRPFHLPNRNQRCERPIFTRSHLRSFLQYMSLPSISGKYYFLLSSSKCNLITYRTIYIHMLH